MIKRNLIRGLKTILFTTAKKLLSGNVSFNGGKLSYFTESIKTTQLNKVDPRCRVQKFYRIS